MKLFIGVFLLSSAGLATADDGVLYFHGVPKLMHGESSIRMVQEFVQAKVYHNHALVYCRFVFRNDGPATLVRIGFPDGASNDWEDEVNTAEPRLKQFRSNVDGKPVALTTQRGVQPRDEASLYHIKTVRFGSHQTRVIEDWYRSRLSGGATSSHVKNKKGVVEPCEVSQFTYMMFSGASWHGPIGKATVQVELMEPTFAHLRTVRSDEIGGVSDCTWYDRLKHNRVVWSGFTKPVVHGNRLIFRRSNFKPSEKDDIALTFNWTAYSESIFGK